MKRIVLSLVMLSLIAACGGSGKTLVTVNGKSITEKDLDFLSEINPRLKMQIASPLGRKQILDNLVEQEMVYQAAMKRGLQRDQLVKGKLELYKKVVIAQAYLESELEKQAKEYYDKNKPEFEKLQLSDILIKFGPAKDEKGPAPKGAAATRTKEAALKIATDIKARLDKGEDFAKLAKEFSDDAISKGNGGDLGKVSKNDPRLEKRGMGAVLEKAYSMKVGETAGPIEAQDGFHVILVTKGLEQQPFDEVKQAIFFKIQGEAKNKIMDDLKKNSKVVFADEKKAEEKPAAEAAKAPEGTAPAVVAPEVKAPEAKEPAKK